MQAAFHEQIRLPQSHEFNRLLGSCMAMGNIDDLIPRKVSLDRPGYRGDLALGPDKDWSYQASAASSAPRREVSSQGCATAVASDAFFLAVAMRCSYFACCPSEATVVAFVMVSELTT